MSKPLASFLPHASDRSGTSSDAAPGGSAVRAVRAVFAPADWQSHIGSQSEASAQPKWDQAD